jgi:hypothetical protein
MLAPYIVGGVLAICGLTWVYARLLYPIPIRFEGLSDDTPEVETTRVQRFRKYEGS